MTTFRTWLILLGLQALLALVLFRDFLFGRYYFAYTDIGSDTYFAYVPYVMHMARSIAREGFAGWSFAIGLGGPTAGLLADPFSLLNAVGGADKVLSLRIWVYLLKLALGGAAFFILIRGLLTRWESAVIAALAYTFCGYVVINGQWDLHATEFVFYPLILWAVFGYLRSGKTIALPVVLALALASGVFFVAVAAFLLFSFLVFVLASSEPRSVLKTWLAGVFPLAAIGYLLAAPLLLPVVFQMMDSPRVSGGGALFERLWQQVLSVNDWPLILVEIGGFFHKDIFGIGNAYRGYGNYFEGPGFFIGVMLLLLVPQLWNRSAADRRLLLLALSGVAAYFVLPVFRYSAMGFAAPYFRVSTLWIALILLLLAARAVDHAIEKGVSGRLLVIGLGGYLLLLLLVVESRIGGNVWTVHAATILGLAALAGALLVFFRQKVLAAHRLPLALLCVVLLETVLIARPSYVEGRALVSPETRGYDDSTQDALREIRKIDKSVFRIEKTYDSASLADAMAQDYMGVKSYYFHGSGVVDFFAGMGLIKPTRSTSNINSYTNWLPNAGPRFMLNSLLGVKYIIAKEAVQWPGYVAVRNARDYRIYRNEFALPLGVVQTRQVTADAFSRLSSLPQADADVLRDIVIINAVIVEKPVPEFGDPFNLDDLLGSKVVSLQDRYFAPAAVLQETGLRIEQFSNTRISGRIHPTKAGILVFSIPYNRGWSLRIDGKATPMMRANFGMLAAPVGAGDHRVELEFQLPGQQEGVLLGILGFVLLALRYLKVRRLAV
ncbi:MAG: YfhO family protein [Burkholderiales bacterium]|nr:YfhO family protein [Burkholderiales bacterium]